MSIAVMTSGAHAVADLSGSVRSAVSTDDREHRRDHQERDDGTGVRRVLVVDDHRSFADLLALALQTVEGFRCVATAATAAEALALALEHRPDVAIVDIELGHDDGLDTVRRLLEALPRTLVAVVSAHDESHWIERAADVGASAYIPKDSPLPEMVQLLRRMEPGQLVVAPRLWCAREADAAHRRAAPGLTARETEVLDRLGRGESVKVVARALGISIHTCRGYVKSLHAKFGVTSQLELLVKAQRLGLFSTRA